MENTNENAVNSGLGAEASAPKEKQKEAFYRLTTVYLTSLGKIPQIPPAAIPIKQLLSKEDKKAIKQKLIDGIKDGTIEYRKALEDKTLKKYCSCLVSHWLKRDPRFS